MGLFSGWFRRGRGESSPPTEVRNAEISLPIESRKETSPKDETINAESEPVLQESDVLEALQEITHPALERSLTELKDFKKEFSDIDGADLRTLEARMAHVERLKKLDNLDLLWYAGRDNIRTSADVEKMNNEHIDLEHSADEGSPKEFGRAFVSEVAIPQMVEDGTPLDEVIKRFHFWQVAGSTGHVYMNRKFKKEAVNKYRETRVSVGEYPSPEPQHVEKLMELFTRQIDSFSSQLEAVKGECSSEEYEEKALEFACYVMHRFVDIHPMMDGNGRTARSLYEYIITKHVGPESRYRHLPVQDTGDNKDTLSYEIKRFHGQIRKNEYLFSSAVYDPERDNEITERDVNELPLLRALKDDNIQTAVFDYDNRISTSYNVQTSFGDMVKQIKKEILAKK